MEKKTYEPRRTSDELVKAGFAADRAATEKELIDIFELDWPETRCEFPSLAADAEKRLIKVEQL